LTTNYSSARAKKPRPQGTTRKSAVSVHLIIELLYSKGLLPCGLKLIMWTTFVYGRPTGAHRCLVTVTKDWSNKGTWVQIHRHCLKIYHKICPKIILRHKLWCHKIILWVMTCLKSIHKICLGWSWKFVLRLIEVDSYHSNRDIVCAK